MRRSVLARGQSNGLSCLTLRSRFLGSTTSQHLLPPYRPFSFGLRAASFRRLGRRREGSSSNDEEKDADTAPSREISPYVKPSAAEEEALSAIQMQSTERSEGVFPYKVFGHETQSVEINLKPGDGIRAEIGALVYMSDGIEMETSTGGGVSKSIARYMTGESFFVTDFNYKGLTEGKIAFGSNYPSKVVPIRLTEHGSELICQKGAFLAGAKDTQIEMFFTKTLTAGFFGGEGFILQKLVGDGLVLIKGGGSLIKKTLQPGETLTVSPGALVAFETSVNFDVKMVSGAKNIIFGGQGLFLSTLTGPGTVWLQSLPFDKLVDAIAYRIPRGGYDPTMLAAMGLHGLMSGGGGAAEGAAGAAGGAAGGAAAGGAGDMAAGAAGGAAGEMAAGAAGDAAASAGTQSGSSGFGEDMGFQRPDVPSDEMLKEEEVSTLDEGEVMGEEEEGDYQGDDDDDDDDGEGGGFFSSLFKMIE